MEAQPGPGQTPGDLYDPAHLRALFDSMAATYERVNTATSFGFSRRWRRQAAAALEVRPGDVVLDAMTGMGEGWPYLGARVGRIVALDLSPGMLRHAAARRSRMATVDIDVREADATATGLPDASVDRVLCLFGLKTLSATQERTFAAEVARVLRPGGRCSLIEVSVPRRRLLRAPYLFYLVRVIPFLGRLLLGDPDNYRMLGVYTIRYGDARRSMPAFRDAGLEVTYVERFFGCATGLVGVKPG